MRSCSRSRMPTPVSHTCSSSRPPRRRQLTSTCRRRCSGWRWRRGCAGCARPAAGRHAPCWPRREGAAHRPFSKAVGSKCRRSLRKMSPTLKCSGVHLHAAAVDAGDVEQLGEQALERVDRAVDAVHELRHSSSWLRRRSASANRPMACSGWRRSWLAAAKNWVLARLATSASLARRVGRRLLGAQLRQQLVGAHLELGSRVVGLPVDAASTTVIAKISSRKPASWQAGGRPPAGDARTIIGAKQSAEEREVDAAGWRAPAPPATQKL